MAGNLRRKRIRLLSWFLYGLGAFIALDGLYMHTSGFSQSQGASTFGIWNLTMTQDMVIIAIVFGLAATVCLVASFVVGGAAGSTTRSRGTGTA